MLDKNVRTVRDWCHKGYLQSSNPGGSHRISGRELKRFLQERQNQQVRKRSLLRFLDEYDFDAWDAKVKHTGESMLLPDDFDLISDNELYSSRKISEYLGVTPFHVRYWVHSGKISSVTPKGKDIRILGKDLKILMFNRVNLSALKYRASSVFSILSLLLSNNQEKISRRTDKHKIAPSD